MYADSSSEVWNQLRSFGLEIDCHNFLYIFILIEELCCLFFLWCFNKAWVPVKEYYFSIQFK